MSNLYIYICIFLELTHHFKKGGGTYLKYRTDDVVLIIMPSYCYLLWFTVQIYDTLTVSQHSLGSHNLEIC